MRRIQVLLEPELDDRLEREAAGRGLSKSALVRECIEAQIAFPYDNGLRTLVGMFPGGKGEPDDSVNHDEIIYEWRNKP
jgi:Ribbon-helix-helix protein, copG family